MGCLWDVYGMGYYVLYLCKWGWTLCGIKNHHRLMLESYRMNFEIERGNYAMP